MNDLNPGDVCVLINAVHEENIGKTVVVKEYLGYGSNFKLGVGTYQSPYPVHAYWVETYDGSESLRINGCLGIGMNVEKAVSERAHLLKIKGDREDLRKLEIVSDPLTLAS